MNPESEEIRESSAVETSLPLGASVQQGFHSPFAPLSTHHSRRDIISHAWRKYKTDNGIRYYYNPILLRSLWSTPYDVIELRWKKSSKEIAVRIERLEKDSTNPWRVAYCRDGRRFFVNRLTKQSFWEAPAHIANLVKSYDDFLAKFEHGKRTHQETRNKINSTESTISLPEDITLSEHLTVKTSSKSTDSVKKQSTNQNFEDRTSKKQKLSREESLISEEHHNTPVETNAVNVDDVEFSVDLADYTDEEKLSSDPEQSEQSDISDAEVSMNPSDYNVEDLDSEKSEERTTNNGDNLSLSSQVDENVGNAQTADIEIEKEEAEAEAEAEVEEEELISIEESVRLVKVALKHHQLDPLSTWEKQRSKLPQNLLGLLSDEDTRELFNQFCREKITELKNSRTLMSPHDSFKQLLQELPLTAHSNFMDVARSKSKDERYRRLDQKSREKLFYEFLDTLKEKKHGDRSVNDKLIIKNENKDLHKENPMHDTQQTSPEYENAKRILMTLLLENIHHPEIRTQELKDILDKNENYRRIRHYLTEKDEKKLIDKALDEVYSQRRRDYYQRINECISLKGKEGLSLKWEDVADCLEKDEICLAFTKDAVRMARYFDKYMNEIHAKRSAK